MRRIRAVPLAAFAFGALAAGVVPAAGQPGPVLPRPTAAVQVTDNPDPGRAHSTPQIAVNPKTRELVIVEAEVRTDKRCRVHVSIDDGRSWQLGGDPMVAPFTDCTLQATNGHYMTLQFDPRGVLWAAWMADDPAVARARNRVDVPRNIYLGRSEDSGRTWQTTVAYEGKDGDPGIGSSRRPMLAVDPRDSRLIVIGWQKGGYTGVPGTSRLSISRDGGRTFGEPALLNDGRGGYQPRPLIDSQGVIHVTFATTGFIDPSITPAPPAAARPLIYRRSTDAGGTWSPIKELAPGNAGFSFMRKPVIAGDLNSGAIYVSWYGSTSLTPRRPPAGQPSTEEFDDREIFVLASPDGGTTWGAPVIVNDDTARKNIQHYDSGLSVAPNGRLDVVWYDFRNSPVPEFEETGGNGGGANDVYYAYSTDGGRTFSPNLRVTDRIIDRTIGVFSNNVHSHTNVGIASTDDTVYVAWQDTRNGGDAGTSAEDIYFAALKFPVAPEGDGSSVPGWVVVAASAAVGGGLTILLALGLARRRPAGAS